MEINSSKNINAPNINGTPIETISGVISKGGLLININSSNAVNSMRTTDGFVGNVETTGIRVAVSAATVSVGIVDSHPFQNSLNTIKFDCSVNTSSYPAIRNFGDGSTPGATWLVEQMKKFGRPVKFSTKYKLQIPINTTNTGGTGLFLALAGYSNTGARGMDITQNITTFNGILTYEFTTGVDDIYLLWGFGYNPGTTGSTYFDWNNFKIQEVNEVITNSIKSNTSALLGFTAIGDTEGIDLSLDLTGAYTNTYTVGTTIVESATTQQDFVGNKTKCMKIGIYIVAKGTGDYTLTVHDSTNIVLISQTITNVNLIVGLNYFTVPYDYIFNLAYHFHVTSTVADGTIKCNTTGDLNTCSYILTYYRACTNFGVELHRNKINIPADNDGFLDGSKIDLENSTFNFKEDFTNPLYLRNYSISGSDLICKINIPGKIISGTFTSDKTITYSKDNSNYSSIIPVGSSIIYVKIASYSGITSFSFNLQINTSGIQKLYYKPTNIPISKTYSGLKIDTTTTTVIYRATKYGFPALEYGDGSYQLLDIDCSASTSTVQLCETDNGTFVTKTDGQSLTITSTTTPVIYTKITITNNRLYLSSNDYNYDWGKDGSSMQNVLLSTVVQGNKYELEMLQKTINEQAITFTDILKNINPIGSTVATDGTGTYNGNNELPLQKALDIGGYIYVKKGDYNINSALRIKGNTVLEFEPGARLIAKPNMDFKLLENINNSGYGTTIVDKNIALIGIEIDGGSTANVSDIKRGIAMSSVERLYMDRCYIYGVGVGSLSKAAGVQLAYCNNFNISNFTGNNNGHYGINIYGGYNGHFDNIHTEGNGRHGFTFIGSQKMTINGLTSMYNGVNMETNIGENLYLRGICRDIQMDNIVIDGQKPDGTNISCLGLYITKNSSDEITQLIGEPRDININNININNQSQHGILIDAISGYIENKITINNFNIKNCLYSGIASQGARAVLTNGQLENITLSGISLNYDGGSINTQCTISNIIGKNIGLSLIECNTDHNRISNITGEDCSQTITNTYPVIYINGNYNTVNGVDYVKVGTNTVDYLVKEGVGKNKNSIGGITGDIADLGTGRVLLVGINSNNYGDGVFTQNISALNLSGTNTGDNSVNTLYSGLVTNATHTGDATGSTALTVVKINGTLMSGLATGILKNTTGTGVPSIAIAGDFPTLNQNTTGNATTATNLTGLTTSVATLNLQSGTNTGDQNLSGLMVKSNNLSDLINTTTARNNLGLGTLATQSGTFSGTSSGTNSGNQTSIVGITGTLAQFNTAITDSDIVDTVNIQTISGQKNFSNAIQSQFTGTFWSGNYQSMLSDGSRQWLFGIRNGVASGIFSFQYYNGTTWKPDIFTIDGDNDRIGVLTSTPLYDLSLGGNSAKTIGLNRHTIANTAGNQLTIQAGGATSGATNKAGGQAIIKSGISTGTGVSQVLIQTYTPGTTGTADNTSATRITVDNLALTVTIPIVMKSYTVATLPTGIQGAKVYVTNALAPTYGTTVVGGGAVIMEVFYNGTNWICS